MIKETLKREWYILLLLMIPFGVSIYLWGSLPEEVPIHFDASGVADDWGPKWINAFLLPSIGVAVYALLVSLPLIDPKKRINSSQKPIAAIRLIMSVFMVVIYSFVMAKTVNQELSLIIYVQVAVGLLILLIGNYMNSVKPNYFVGVRTPWTLENEEVWKKTHSFTAKLWTLGGLFMIIVPFLSNITELIWVIIVGLVLVLSLIPIVYSYLINKKLESVNV